jgi:hypothetical protein
MTGAPLEAVLPLVTRDLERCEKLLLPSLRHFFPALDTCWVVTPQREVPVVRSLLADPRFRVIAETDLIPELRVMRPEWIGGWFVQQAIKLSAARIVASDFYLTLDADVVCVQPIATTDLVNDGRGIVNVDDSQVDPHANWYRWAERVLGFPRSGRSHGVTPAVLCSAGVRLLLEFLEERLRSDATRAEAYLLAHLPWTEYTLYYTYLEQHGLFDAYHFPAARSTYGNNLWKGQDETTWDPARSFAPDRRSYFSVLQSHTVTSIDGIVAKIRAYYASLGEPSPF